MSNNLIELSQIWYPDEYETTYIYTYPAFNDELKEMISKSGYVKEFKIKYHKSLRFLENLKRNCVEQSSLFECLKETEGLHAMRLKGKKNIRILFSFEKIKGREIVILYCCFQEKNSKDYENSKRIAYDRKNKLIC
jgi:heterodisulfide reductase subunit A-like polyferredoxin